MPVPVLVTGIGLTIFIMVCLYFGLPGCGKTTLLTSIAYKFRKLKKYKHIYSNVPIAIDNVTFIKNSYIGKYDLSDSLILIDEASLYADSRDYKNFSREKLQFFLLHRHYNCDILLFTQQWDGIDRKIRVITDRVYYVFKSHLFPSLVTCYYRIPYGIIIPDPKKDNQSASLGEIIQGYCKPSLLVRLFSPKLFRPKYYKFFDSWSAPYLPPIPDNE